MIYIGELFGDFELGALNKSLSLFNLISKYKIFFI